MLIGKMSNIEMRVSFSDEKTILWNLSLSTGPEDKNMVKIDMEEDLLNSYSQITSRPSTFPMT